MLLHFNSKGNMIINVKEMINSVCMYIFLLFTSGFYFRAFNGKVVLVILLINALVFLLNNKGTINNSRTLIQIIPVILILITGMVCGDSVKDIMITITYILVAIIMVNAVNVYEYIRLFVSVMYVIEIASLIVFGLLLVSPAVISIFPTLVNENGYHSNFLILTFGTIENTIRNYGLFWEPGAYQIYISIAMALEMVLYEKVNKKHMVIGFVAILTTTSSTGIVTMVLIFMLSLSIGKKAILSKAMKILVGVLCAGVVMYEIYPYLPDDLKFSFAGKLEAFFLDKNSEYASISARQLSIEDAITCFKSSPIFGVGKIGYLNAKSQLHTMTALNWFAQYGIVYGLIMIAGMMLFAQKLSSSKLTAFWIIAIMLISSASEEVTVNPSFIIFIFYGLGEIIATKRKAFERV